MTITQYGADALVAWADIEDQLRRSFYPVTPREVDFKLHVVDCQDLREAIKGYEASPVIMDAATVDAFPVDEDTMPDQGYRLNLGNLGDDDDVIVVFARQNNPEGIKAPNGDVLPNLPQPVGYIDPGAEYDAERLLRIIGAVYRAYSTNGDRGYYIDPAEKAARLERELEEAKANGIAARRQKAKTGSARPDSLESF